jgi:hypothetical protein
MGRKIAVSGIALSVGVMVAFNVVHKLSLALFIVMPLVCSAFIVAGWIVHHIAGEGEDEDGLGRSRGAGNCREVVTGFRRARIGRYAPCGYSSFELW